MKRLSIGIALSLVLAFFTGPVYADRATYLIIVPVEVKVKSVNQGDQSVKSFEMKVGQDGKLTILQDGKTLRPGQFLPNGDYVQDQEVLATLTSSGKIVSYGETVPATVSRDGLLKRKGVPFLQVFQGKILDVSPDRKALVTKSKVGGKAVEIHHSMTLQGEPQGSRLVAYLLAISMLMAN